MAYGKEPNFYSIDDRYEKGEDFFWSDRFGHYKGEHIAGDFSTHYMTDATYQKSLSRIFDQRLPESTFFSSCIRHPVMWHWSHYLHRVRNADGFRALKPIAITFEQYLEDKKVLGKLDVLEGSLKRLKHIYSNPSVRHNLLMLIYERDISPDISVAYQKICQLLSIDPANFVPIKGILSNERTESIEVIRRWAGPGTFKNVKANRAYFPAIYRAKSAGESESGEIFSPGDIIVERDAANISVFRNPDLRIERKFLEYYDKVSTDLSVEQVSSFTEEYFQESIKGLKMQLEEDVPEWNISALKFPDVEIISPSYI